MKYEDDINEILNNKTDSKKPNKLSENAQFNSIEEFIEQACTHEQMCKPEFGCVVNFPEGQEDHLYELSCFLCSSDLTIRFIKSISAFENSIKEINEKNKRLEIEIYKLKSEIDNIG